MSQPEEGALLCCKFRVVNVEGGGRQLAVWHVNPDTAIRLSFDGRLELLTPLEAHWLIHALHTVVDNQPCKVPGR